jgi:hypothetical protein
MSGRGDAVRKQWIRVRCMPCTHCRAILRAGQDAIVERALLQVRVPPENLPEGHENTPMLPPGE